MERLTERFSNGQAAVLGCGNNCEYDFKYCKMYNENCPTMTQIYEKLAHYEDMEEQGKLIKLPCKPGDTVYIITECEEFPKVLDGTMYDYDGSPGTATGYYCAYEDDCPHDCEEFSTCDDYCEKKAVFKDYVTYIQIAEDGIYAVCEKTGFVGKIGEDTFHTEHEAQAALEEMNHAE